MQQNKENEPKTANIDNNSMSVEEITLIRDKYRQLPDKGQEHDGVH